MISTRPTGGKIRPADRRERLPLSPEEIARQMRSRRRQLEILRKMIAEREGRHDGR